MKRMLCLFLALILAVGICFSAPVTITASAAEAVSGTCGATENDNLTWSLVDGTLTISGTGAMADFNDTLPWSSYSLDVTKIIIGEGVTSIDEDIFNYWCYFLESIEVDENNAVYLAIDGVLFDKNKEKLICYPAAKTGTSYTIPGSVETIADYAFKHCTLLTSVTISDSVTTIGREAFCACDFLESITIPDSVETIGDEAFGECILLRLLEIGKGVTSIGNNAFYCCDGLKSIEVDANNTAYSDIEGVLFNKNKTKLICYPAANTETSYTIPDSVETIADYAFKDCSLLTSVTIPDSIETIGENAFYWCTALTSITIPYSVETIGDKAFAHCRKLEEITILNSKTKFGTTIFNGCDALTTVNVPCDWDENKYTFKEGVLKFADHDTTKTATCISKAECSVCGEYGDFAPHTYINGKCTVEGCGYACAHKTITDGVCVTCRGKHCGKTETDKVVWFYDVRTTTLIISGEGEMANFPDDTKPWYNCIRKITRVVINKGVTSIGEFAFDKCTLLEAVTIGEAVTTIGDYAFAYCSFLRSVTMGDSVTTIGANAFKNCTALTTVNVPCSWNENPLYTFEDGGAVNIERHTLENNTCTVCEGGKCGATESDTVVWFYDEGNLYINGTGAMADYDGSNMPWYSYQDEITNVVIENGVTTIGEFAFNYCSFLTSVTIPESVTSIGNFAFAKCTSLEAVTIGEGVTTIGDYAFSDCTFLTTLTIGNKVSTIGDSAFSNCAGLESVTIPDSVTTISGLAFLNCSNLTSVTIPKNVTTIDRYAFDGCAALTSINVDDANTKYSSVDGVLFNKDKTELIYYPLGKTETSYTVPDSVTKIGEGAFINCTALTSVTIGKGVTEIDDYAFDGCNNLLIVNVPCDWDTENPLYAFGENVNVEVADHKEIIYVDNNDGTHTEKYSCCGTVIGKPEDHSFNGSEYCEFCEYQCPHEKYSNGVCDVCKCYCPHTNTKPVYKSYEDNTNQHYKYYECCGLEEWAGYHEDENGDTKCDECEVQLVAKAYLEPWTSQGVRMGDNYFVSLENAVDKVNEIYGEELFLLSDATINEGETLTLESAVFNTNGNKLTVNGTLIISAEKYNGVTIPDGVIGSGTIKIGENTFKFADNEKWSCAEESQHTGSVQTCVGYLCELCGNYYGEANDNHDIVIDEAKEPTCTETGLTEGQHCTRCDDKTVAQEVVPALNHKGTLVQVEAKAKTCTTVGWEAYEYCTACDYTTYVEIPASHEIVKVNAKAKTCKEAGHNAHEYCTECDYTTKVEIPASHELQEVKAKAPTCEAIGYDAYKYCTECDYTTYVEKAKLGHDIVIDKAVEATCTETGLTEGSHCTRCDGATVKQEVIPKKGHTEIKGGTPDVHTKCDVCEDILSAEHEFTKIVTKEPTQLEMGVTLYSCSCGYSYEEEIACVKPGEIEAEVDKSNSFSASVEDVNSVIAKLQLTDEEKALIEQGADMKIVFKLSDIGATINTPEKKAIFKALTNEKIAVFLDIQLVKQIANSSVNVQKLNDLIKVTVELPAELVNKDGNIKRSYSVLRYHDGDETKVTTLNAKFDETTGTLTFETDRFSTYAIVYSDVVVSDGEGVPGTPDPGDGEVSTPENPKNETTPNTPEVPKDNVSNDKNDDSVTNDKNDASSETGTNDKNDTSKDDVPKAGVISTTSIWLGAMALSGFGALLVSKKKKEND